MVRKANSQPPVPWVASRPPQGAASTTTNAAPPCNDRACGMIAESLIKKAALY